MKSDPAARNLYESHRDSLVSYAGKISGDPAGAEDIVQDAWLLYDRQRRKSAILEPLGYVKRIVRNLVISQHRRGRFQAQLTEPELNAVMHRLVDETPSAEAQMLAREELRIVMDAIDGLPERQAAAFRMYHFEGMKLREVATRLGISTSLVHNLVTEAMQLCDERRNRGA